MCRFAEEAELSAAIHVRRADARRLKAGVGAMTWKPAQYLYVPIRGFEATRQQRLAAPSEVTGEVYCTMRYRTGQ